jgi:phage host-nuclease inhibitor protein Gam
MSELPMPPELAAPEPDADAWVHQLADQVAAVAAESSVDADDLAAGLAADEWTEDAGASWVPEPARRWTVTDDGTAEWAMRHVAAADAELAALGAQADEWAGRIKAWFDQRARPVLATRGFMAAHLEAYALRRREANPKHKTLTLPSGVVRTSYVSAKVEVDDDATVAAWAEEHGLASVVKVTKKVYVGDLRDEVEVVDWPIGVKVVAACGCVDLQPDGTTPPPPGAGWFCHGCGPTMVGKVEVARWGRVAALVRCDAPDCVDGRSAEGGGGVLPCAQCGGTGRYPQRVPATHVKPEQVTAKSFPSDWGRK